ncbi:malto-oligosyltrehalose synthase [Xanthobacter sp. ZOL 2024]
MSLPRGMARLRLNKNVSFDTALALVDYFADLGVSHLHLSPLLASRPGLAGGVLDHTQVDPVLGGEAGLRRLVAALRRRQMGLVADIAPAYLAVGGADSPVWADILEWGRDASHAHWLDVDWRGGESGLRNTLLAPFLDQPYGAALAAGTVALAFDAARGRFEVRHGPHTFPICPRDYSQMLEASPLPSAEQMRAVLARLPRMRPSPAEIAGAKASLARLAGTTEGRSVVAAVLAAFDARTELGRARLHRLLERQAYRLAWWGTAGDELNWRHHPDTPALAALRVERADVFDATHTGLLRLYGEGLLDGFVIQQWDLLADPLSYARRLRLKLDALAAHRPREAGALYLAAGTAGPTTERATAGVLMGTSDAARDDALGALFHDPTAATPLTDIWTATSGDRQRYGDKLASVRREAIRDCLGAELQLVARALHEVGQGDLTTRDITFAAIKRVVLELAVALPVRRTYADLDGFDARDAAVFRTALERARRRISPLDSAVADQLAQWLGDEPPRQLRDIEQSGAREHAIAAFQQFTAALARVALDDTLLYRLGRLVSRNEVGADPTLLGLSVDAFHQRAAARAPQDLIATTGPRQKRGEDARLRLAVLSEMPGEWERALRQLVELTAPFRTRLQDGVAPEPTDVVLLLQTLVGAWPATLRADDALALGDLHDRLQAWWLKAIRGARVRTRAVMGSADYEAGCLAFLKTLMEERDGMPARRLLAELVARVARAGALNALSHCVLKLTLPGIPELFHGGEFWDLSLEGTDVGRAGDYLGRTSGLTAGAMPDKLMDTYLDGRVKQATVARLLELRGRLPALFSQGDYAPLTVEGRLAEHAVAFSRRHRGQHMVVVATRLALRLLGPETTTPKVPTLRWSDTAVVLPDALTGTFSEALTGRVVDSRLARFDLSDLLLTFPAAVLVRS